MWRRTYLIGVGGLAAIAGCAGEDTEEINGTDDDEDDGDTDEENDTDDDAESPEEDDEPEGEAALEIVADEFVIEEGDFTTDVFVEFEVVNDGDGPSGDIEIGVDWYDEGGDYLGDANARLATLGAGETWLGRVYQLGTEAEDVDDYEIEGEFSHDPPSEAPDSVELLESDIDVSEDEARVSGRIENNTGDSIDYLQVTAILYDEDGNVMGDEWTNESDIPEGETWSFDMTWLDRRRADQVVDHTIFIADSAF